MVQTNLFNLVIGGTKLTTVPSSVHSDGVHQSESAPPIPQVISNSHGSGDGSEDDGWIAAIIILIIIIIIILIILILLLLLIKNRKQKKVCNFIYLIFVVSKVVFF